MTERPTNGPPSVDELVDQLLARPRRPVPRPGEPARRDPLDLQEQEIKDAVLRMGALVEEAIRRASQSLVEHDADLALDVIKADARINDAQREVSRLISVTIATQQPVARDLRYLLTLDHVTYELERIGDHASSVAKQVIKLAPSRRSQEYVQLPEMAERAAVLVHGVLRALVDVGRGRRARGRRPWTTRSTGCTTRPSTRSSS